MNDGNLPPNPWTPSWFDKLHEEIKQLYPKTMARLGNAAQNLKSEEVNSKQHVGHQTKLKTEPDTKYEQISKRQTRSQDHFK